MFIRLLRDNGKLSRAGIKVWTYQGQKALFSTCKCFMKCFLSSCDKTKGLYSKYLLNYF